MRRVSSIFALILLLVCFGGAQACVLAGAHVGVGAEKCGSEQKCGDHVNDEDCSACPTVASLSAPLGVLPPPATDFTEAAPMAGLIDALQARSGQTMGEWKPRPAPDPLLSERALSIATRALPARGPNFLA